MSVFPDSEPGPDASDPHVPGEPQETCAEPSCSARSLPGEPHCAGHRRERLRSIAASGGQAKARRSERDREARAAALRLDTVADMRTAATEAFRLAFTRGDAASAVASIRVAASLLEAELAEMKVQDGREARAEWDDLTGKTPREKK